MIVPIKNFTGHLGTQKIDDAAEKNGYEGYIPYGFITDLYYAWTYTLYDKNFEDGLLDENPYEKSFIKLLSMINFKNLKGMSGLDIAFNILKKYGTQLNLRAIESSRSSGSEFVIKEEEDQQNYLFDLASIPDSITSMLGIDLAQNINTIKLTEEVEYILKYFNNLQFLPGTIEDEPILIRNRMTSHSQIMKASKKRLLYPTFKYDYMTKNLDVKIPIVEQKDKSTMILLIDLSSSVMGIKKYIYLYKAVLLYLFSNFRDNFHKVKIYYFSFDILNIEVVTTKDKLKELFTSQLVYKASGRGWSRAVKYFKKLFRNETIILLTDGEFDAMNLDQSSSNKYHVISLKDNDVLKNLARNSDGMFIKI